MLELFSHTFHVPFTCLLLVYTVQNKTLKHSILQRINNCPMSPYSSTYDRFLSFHTFRLKSIKIKPQQQKSIVTRKFVLDFYFRSLSID